MVSLDKSNYPTNTTLQIVSSNLQVTTTTSCKITLLPSEILIQICSYLTPYELLLLSETCVRFKKFLDAPKSSTTQEIWKNSKKAFVSSDDEDDDDMNPPEGMCKRDYFKLLYYKECSFCENKDKYLGRIFWQFKVRCCSMCLMKNTISLRELLTKYVDMPENLILTIPYICYNYTHYFWTNSIKYIYIKYLIYLKSTALRSPQFHSFVDSLKSNFESVMNYAREKERVQEKKEMEYRKRYRRPLLSRLQRISFKRIVFPISRLEREMLRIKERLTTREKFKSLKQRFDRFDERTFLENKQVDKQISRIKHNKKRRGQKNQNGETIKRCKDNRKKFSHKYG
ncbi:13030_t:CDS:2 [Funneliformis caledonium]|uniref:13030_t:CDS:1 n=1 Tax=Funneliformis caledonium TaxID=1117310 RepID=A0A9N8YVA4_9GLOM|nr:13030_t:CDS:2 [Funneliformis caledonium]